MDMNSERIKIEELYKESIAVKTAIINSGIIDSLLLMGSMSVDAIKQGGKIIFCGNGGSAADAQHLAAELVIRLRPNNNREGIPAITLAQDVSTITACANDFGYEHLFERTIRSLGNKGDVLIGISTSGESENVLLAMQAAKEMGITVFGFLGTGGGRALELCDEAFVVPSDTTGRVQESHITGGHALCEYIEDSLIQDGYLHL
jgi:D-sedoheptulose 7-phosphate isomerase